MRVHGSCLLILASVIWFLHDFCLSMYFLLCTVIVQFFTYASAEFVKDNGFRLIFLILFPSLNWVELALHSVKSKVLRFHEIL